MIHYALSDGDGALARRILIGVVVLLVASVVVGWIGRTGVANEWFDTIDGWVMTPSTPPSSSGFLDALGESSRTKGVIVAGVIFAIVLASRKLYVKALVLLGAGLLAGIAQSVLKHWVGRVRPNDLMMLETGAFPSGQTMISVAVYGLFAWLLARSLSSKTAQWIVGAVAVVYILLTGWSRLALGEHYLTDVMAGYILGLVWLITGAWIAAGTRRKTVR